MKSTRALLLCSGLALLLCTAQSGAAIQSSNLNRLPGQELAKTITLLTGVAISPLLGVGAIGAWEYYQADTPEEQARLHWYSNPSFWIPALTIVLLCFIKDTAGTALPVAIKKPFDLAEAIENKVSGLVAMGAFVPIAAAIFKPPVPEAALGAAGLAAADLSWMGNAVLLPIAWITFAVVFLASNAINVLILLSPFATVDAALKLFRTAILGSILVSAWIHPWAGAVLSVVIILCAWLIVGWSFRLTHLGIVFVWEWISLAARRFTPAADRNPAFLGKRIEGVPVRTFGRMTNRDDGAIVFEYRPWLVFPKRALILPSGSYEVGRGFLYSEILLVTGNAARTVLLLSPKYRGHEEQVAAVHRLRGVRETGLRAAWAWLKSVLGTRTRPAPLTV